MTEASPDLRRFAIQLAGGPAFLLIGKEGLDQLGSTSLGYRWNGVYTSTIGRAVAEAFEDETRVSTSLGPMTRSPSRSQSDLEVRFLFGGVHLPEMERPPTSAREEATARIKSTQELTRLITETVTPRGTVVVEGWVPGERLRSEELLPLLGELGPGQAHLFSADIWRTDPLVESFVDDGKLVLHSAPLEDVLVELLDAGMVRSAASTASSQHVVPLGDGFVDVDIHTWNQVRRSARPVDLAILTPPVFASDAARYQEFRNFVGATQGVPQWRGIAAGMNLRRDFEPGLRERVYAELHDRDLPAPIVVVGQTATGKTVALSALAMDLARSGEFAVLHQSRRTVRPSVDDIDMYSAWATDHRAKATVLIWDGMIEPEEYEGLARQLHARGRKVMVVGSAYITRSGASSTIVAAAELSTNETERLLGILTGFGYGPLPSKHLVDTNFLAFLYRMLPETEYQLRSGLSQEMRSAERIMSKLASQHGKSVTTEQRLTAMQEAFIAAGIVLEDLLPQDATHSQVWDQSFADRAPLQRVTTLVLVAGRYGIPVPIDLALRVVGREGFESVRAALVSSDIIREIEDDNGDFFLSVRSQLEAELLAQIEIPLPVEIEVLAEAISSVRISDGFSSRSGEVEFIVKVLERIGPSSDRASKYRSHYGDITEALRSRRFDSGRTHPRLVLQESHFARGFVHWQQKAQMSSVEDRIAGLEYNRELLEDVLADRDTRGLIRLSLAVELASTLGSIIYELAHAEDQREIASLATRLDDVLTAVLSARAVDPGNVYPVDVLAWSTRDAVKSGSLNSRERVDYLANAVATLESLDRSSLTNRQRADLDKRGAELSRLLHDDEGVWEYLGKLELNSSPAATYFLAQFDAKEGPEGETRALKRLREASPETRADWRCAQLLIDLTWKDLTGNRLLSGERVPLYLTSDALREIAQLSADLGDADLPDSYRLLFVRAIAEFIAGQHAEASRLFRQVEDSTRQLSKRIYTRYLIADETSRPVPFSGRVEFADSRSGQVWVEKLGTRVRFDPKLFSASGGVARDQQLPSFFVGFNLAGGPVAEPRSVFRRQQRR